MENFEYIVDRDLCTAVSEGFEVVTNMDLWEFVKFFVPDKVAGFEYCRDPTIRRIINEIAKSDFGHSGRTLARTMQNLHFIAKYGIDYHKQLFR